MAETVTLTVLGTLAAVVLPVITRELPRVVAARLPGPTDPGHDRADRCRAGSTGSMRPPRSGADDDHRHAVGGAAEIPVRRGNRHVPTVPVGRRFLFADRRRASLTVPGVAASLMLVLILDGIFAGAVDRVT